jgi:hypothetical protein
MQLRSKKYAEIMGFLRRPQTLLPEFTLDIEPEEYIRKVRKYKYYNRFAFSLYYPYSINNTISSRTPDTFINIFKAYENIHSVVDRAKLDIITTYNKLKNSEMYDTTICKMGLLEKDGSYFLCIHFPKLFLSAVNSDSEPIELRDMYCYINNSSLYVFRTTLDIINKDFIHPHVGGNFNNYCLGESPFRMSLDNLRYNFNEFNENDADIFWINFYRTITQKTEHGDHFYALSKLDKGIDLDSSEFLKIIYTNEDFIKAFSSYINISILNEEIAVSINKEAVKVDFFTLFSYETFSVPDEKRHLGYNVKFNNRVLNKVKLTKIYKKPRKLYGNIDILLNYFVDNLCPTSLINNTYDDYKEKLKESNNSGEQSVEQNQIFEFQML